MITRYKQANKEAKISLWLTITYLIAWIMSAYCISDKIEFLGLPVWFEISCIMVPIAFILLCWIIVKFQFKNISLD